MEFQFPAINYLYLVAFVMASCLSVFSALVARTFGSRLWVAVMVSFAIWTLGELLANMGTTLAWQLGFQRLVYLGVICAVTSWLLFAIHYAGQERWLSARVLVLLLVVPVCSLIMVSTLEWHSLLYTSAELIERNGYLVLDLEYGVGFWLQIIASSYLYTLGGSFLLLRTSIRRPRIYRSQSILVGIAALMPVVPNMLYVTGVDLAGGFDPTSLFFVISAVLVTVATQQYHFLSLSPVARDLVFDSVNIAVVVVNSEHCITDVNPAFTEITGGNASDVLGKSLSEVFVGNFDGMEVSRVEASWQGRLRSKKAGRLFDVTSMPVVGYRKEQIGYLILLNDVTLVQKALDEISRLAGTDMLTELPNRRAMQSWHGDVAEDADETKNTANLVVVADIDHFKALNDQHGHPAGDKVLTELAALIRANLRPSDKLARWGGEEFCLILMDTEPRIGINIIERLRQRIESHHFETGEGGLQITMTFGVVAMRDGETMDQAIERADLVMYSGKVQGRNCVVSDL